MPRTLIVGCGYLGRRVGRLLAAQGDSVFGTTRNEARGATLQAEGISPILMDISDPSPLLEFAPFDRAVYALGFDRKSGRSRHEVVVDGLLNVLDRLTTVPRILFTSTTGVYGQEDGSWVDETSPTEPTDESGRTALEAEQVLRSRRPDAIIVRLAGLYGPGRIIRRDALLAREPIVGNADSYLNLIHIDDAAAVVVAALQSAPSGATYVASDDRPLPRREFYRTMAAILGAPEPRFETGEGIRREKADRRVSNRRLKAELKLVLRYPDVETGLAAALTDERGPDLA